MNKPLFILNEAPGTDPTVPPKSSLVNQTVYWGHLQEHAGGVPCGSMGALKPDASLKSPPNWHEARKDEPQEPQGVICRQIHRGAPPARLLVAAFCNLRLGPCESYNILRALSLWASLPFPVPFPRPQEETFQFRENSCTVPKGAGKFGEGWREGAGAKGRWGRCQPSTAGRRGCRRWKKEREIQQFTGLHWLIPTRSQRDQEEEQWRPQRPWQGRKWKTQIGKGKWRMTCPQHFYPAHPTPCPFLHPSVVMDDR